MNARNLGFMSSWHMLTRDKGWIKPVLVLTLVGWIPILGQIALLGYGLEWARLTAWGVDSALKQRGVDYGKVLSTGGRAFLVNLSLGVVIALILQIVFPGSLGWLVSSLSGMGYVTATAGILSGMGMTIAMLVASVFVGTFLHAAMMRATLYDDFGAGWRLDRLAQMVGRDFGGFCKTWLVSFVGSLISGIYAFVVTFVGMIVVLGGLFGATAFVGMSGGHMGYDEMALSQLLSWGAGPVLLFVVAAIAVLFIGNVIGTAMSLVAMNAMGQWFCRFDVNRWGVSADPLPADVPHRETGWAGAAANMPTDPQAQAASGGVDARQVGEPAAKQHAPEVPVQPPVSTGEPAGGEQVADVVAASAPVVEPVLPLDAPVRHGATEGVAGSAPEQDHDSVMVEESPAELDLVDEDVAREAAEVAARCVDSQEVPAEPAVEEQADKKPIPLGPISSDDDESFENGPVDA
ncbi:MAG: DUF4013 domain-containing protein [Coriobacteriaceae bacterium]|nr:DUF4013 domain-containing protein [Coriobacteriaceae bacterium]